MLLNYSPFHRRYKGFRFESCWLHLSEFQQIVLNSWAQPVQSYNMARVLHIKLARLAKRLKQWHRERLAVLRQEARAAQEVVLQMDRLHDQRPLTEDENCQRKESKNKIMGLAAMRKIRIRQRSRLTWTKMGDTNTKLFHLRANARRWKNFIPIIHCQDGVHTTQDDKAVVL
jgi:hypothetical protein